MGANGLLITYLILNALKSLVYIFIIIMAARRLKDRSSPALWLVGYAGLAFAMNLFQLAADWGFFPALNMAGRLRLDEYTALLLALILYQSLRVFLGKERKLALFFGGLALSAVLIFLQNVLLVFLAWLAFTILSVVVLLRTLGQTLQHLHRNRMFYWLPVLILAAGNELTLFYRQDMAGGYLRMGAAAMMAYVVLRHHIPDTRDFARQFFIYFSTTLVTMAVYVTGFTLADAILKSTPGYNPLFVGAGLAVFISLIFTPLFGFVRNIVNRLFKLQSYDPSQTLREYSASISNILDLEKLVTVAVGLIIEALEIDKGFLFLVDPEIGEDSKNVFRLTGVRGAGTVPGLSGTLADDSPISLYLREERTPLLQYDIDFAPGFMNAPIPERKWLSGLMLDVYVPIFSKGEWIGLLALGPKPNSRYTDEDLNMLATIASQTGVALENARLVENLKKLNAQVREAYSFLDKANHDLAKLELTKSNFISIASHELRTPLTVARGYAEMLLEEPTLPETVRELVKGIHKSTLRLHEIMDSMFDIAQMDARSLELQTQDVFITELIRSVGQELSKLAGERSQEFTLDLPQLPSIKADPNNLRKLFYHLMINAVKFTPNGGKVTITGKQLSPNNRDLPEGGVEIVVSDTGVGIAKDYQEVIFTKFYQPGELLNRHSTGKTKFKGSGVGLGLALSRGIVEAHGGKIWVESPGYDEEKFPGSDFHVILPLRSQGESKTVRMGSAVKLKL
jgi:signal transduction histidine kinase